MASLPVRDPVADHLLTPQNSALVVIDYQPSQFARVRSMDRDLLLENIVSTVKTAKAFDLPIGHSTINVATGRGRPTVPELVQLLENTPPIDRTTTNASQDADFVAAAHPTERRKLILCALWTEICMAFPAVDALREGYEVYPVVDAIGAPARRPTSPASSESCRPARSRSPGSPSPSSFSATGHARKRSPTLSRSCLPIDC